MKRFKNLIRRSSRNLNQLLGDTFNFSIIRSNRLDRITSSHNKYRKLYFLKNSKFSYSEAFEISELSTSQLGQDLFALSTNNYKNSGYFVEFGATNGKDLSNTYLLEKKFNWTGILAEPAPIWHKDLLDNRACTLDFSCITDQDDQKLTFLVTEKYPEISTLKNKINNDHHKRTKMGVKEYEVYSISLGSLLKKYNAPKEIDFLSIDTEGSEFEILSGFDFSEYSFNAICVEHNYQEARKDIFELLMKNGYVRVYTEFSDFDDWYVRAHTRHAKQN